MVGRGSRKIQTLSQGDWYSPEEGTLLDLERAEPWCSAGPRLGAFINLAASSNWCASIFSGEASWSFGSLAPPIDTLGAPRFSPYRQSYPPVIDQEPDDNVNR
jgi:hypothetical protein